MMKEWIPIPGTSKEKIIRIALEEFGKKGYKGVNMTDLAEKANVTTGAIYHHFGSKKKLYEIVKDEMEQRIVDRMEGVISIFDQPTEGLAAALIAGLKFVVQEGICKMISEVEPNSSKIAEFLSKFDTNYAVPLSIILNSSWRSVIKAISENQITVEQGENLIKWMFKKGE